MASKADIMSEDVAPHAGAWIETAPWTVPTLYFKVAPHAGAWIETWWAISTRGILEGRAPRGRVD
jgi:hypothetical protein